MTVACGLAFQKSVPERDAKYLAFVRTHPCALCGKRFGIEAAHFGPHGFGSKASDYQAMPLCRSCHRKQGRMDIATFEATFHVNPYLIAFTMLVAWHVIQMNRWHEVEQRRAAWR